MKIRDLNPYPAYNPSGVEWLGEVPAHWGVAQVKRHYSIQLGKMLQNRPTAPTDVEVPYLKAQNVQWFSVQTTDVPTMWASLREVEQYGIRAGDLLVCEGGEGGRCGLVGEVQSGYIIQNALHRVRPSASCRNDYLQYVMSAIANTGWFDALNSKATIAHFTVEKFASLTIPVPPLPQQTDIARYLDHADRRIRRYISAKHKLVRLLEEQRQAVIHRAVTQGLDPTVHLKPSGISRLGDVPAHWEVLPLKRLGRFSSGSGFPIDEQGKRGLDLPFFKVSDMNLPGNDRVMTIQYNSVSHSTARRLGATVFPAGTIIFPKVGGALLTNKRRLLERPCCIDNNLMGCIVRRNPQFVLLLLEHIDLATIAKPGPVPAVSEGEVREIRTAVPPLPEQNAIVAYIGKATADLDTAIAHTRRQIKLLHEYRAHLIADVVTGKLDVREAAAKLPDTDPVPTDETEASINAEGEAQR